MTRFPQSLCMVLVLCSGAFGCAGPEEDLSPTIANLGEMPSVEQLETFWVAAEKQGTPLIEAADDSDDQQLATFLWQGDSETRNVLVSGIGGFDDFAGNTMAQIAGTDVWYRTYLLPGDFRASYYLSPNDLLSMPPPGDREALIAQVMNYQTDPLNKSPWTNRRSSFSLSPWPGDRWLEDRESVPKGVIETVEAINSTVLGNQRRIDVYLPPGRQGDVPFLLFFDGRRNLTDIPVPKILDNLIAEGKISPVAALFVGNAPGLETRTKELACNDDFLRFVTDELLPWAHDNFPLSNDPMKTSWRNRVPSGGHPIGTTGTAIRKGRLRGS